MGAEYEQIGGRDWVPSKDECGVDADSVLRKDDDLSLPRGGSPFACPNKATYLLVERMPHVTKGERAFSRQGVMRRAFVLACYTFLGAVLTHPAISEDGSENTFFLIQTSFIVVFFSIWCIVMNETKVRIWPKIYPVVACLSVTFWGSCTMHLLYSESDIAVFVATSIAVLFLGCVTWFRFISDRIRSRARAWLAIALSVALPSYGLCLLIGGDRVTMLFICAISGAGGALGFMQNLWATDHCAADNRDARFEWYMAWLMAFTVLVVFASDD